MKASREPQEQGDGAEAPPAGFVSVEQAQAMVDDAVALAMEKIVATLATARGAPSGEEAPAEELRFARMLAMQLAELTDQGTSRRRVAPEVMAMRAHARDAIVEVIARNRAAGVMPTYRLVHKVYLGERLIEPLYLGADHKNYPEEIEYGGIPSMAMRPHDAPAKEVFDLFLKWTGSVVPDEDQALAEGRVTIHGHVVIKSRVESAQAPQIGGGGGHAGGDVAVKSKRGQPGQILERRVLGTVAAPARATA